jgi:hypothetical protein
MSKCRTRSSKSGVIVGSKDRQDGEDDDGRSSGVGVSGCERRGRYERRDRESPYTPEYDTLVAIEKAQYRRYWRCV